MEKIFKNGGKILTYTFGIMAFIFIIWAMLYMDEYRNLYTVHSNKDGIISIADDTNTWAVFKAVLDTTYTGLGKKWIVNPLILEIDEFYFNIQAVNNQILSLGVLNAVLFAVMLIGANHSRKKYYLSNLIIGIVTPIISIIYSLILFSKNSALIPAFNDNKINLNIYSLAHEIGAKVTNEKMGGSLEKYTSESPINELFNVTTRSFTITNVLCILMVIVSIAYILFTILKYSRNISKGGNK